MQNCNSKVKINKCQQSQDAIILQNVSKKYILTKERPLLLKNLFIPQKKEEIWALRDVSLTIKKGETIGIIGENGSGKSTLLKIISGITSPTSGSVQINGRVASLIELGAGFHPDLTGRENVYLNATLLGLTKKEIDKKYKEIVEFADIGEFIDQPVRIYSSGMTVRLGFSVAVHLDPDILLIDEVLAVGDEEFQGKCIEVLIKLKELKKTIAFVSHNLDLIEKFTNTTIFIDNGRITSKGNPKKVLLSYLKNKIIGKNLNKKNYSFINGVKIKQVVLEGISLKRVIKYNKVLGIKVLIEYTETIKKTFVGYVIKDEFGKTILTTNTFVENIKIREHKKGDKLTIKFLQKVPFKQGKYSLQIHTFLTPHGIKYFDLIENAADFVVENNYMSYGSIYIKPKIEII